MGRHIPSAPREYSHHSREGRCNRTEELGSSAWILLHSLLNASYTTMLLYWVDAMLESIKYYMICTGWFCSVVFCQWRMYSLLVCSFLACSLGLRLSAWRTFGQVHNRIHHCTSPSLLMKFYIVVVCDVSRSEYTHALGHYLGGGQVGSTLWSLGIGAVDDDAPMDILPEIEEEVPKLVSTFRNPHFRWFGRDVMDWITMIHRGRPWALFSGVVLRARRGETTWLFFSLRLSFGMIGSSGWYCYQN